MNLFKRRGYWDDKNPHSVVDKIEGYARFAGIAAAGLVVGIPVISRVGNWSALRASEEMLSGKLGGKLAGRGVQDAISGLFSPEFNILTEGPSKIRSMFATTVAAQEREKLFFEELGGFVQESSKEVFHKNHDTIVSMLGQIGKAGDLSDLEDNFTSFDTMTSFNKQAEKMGIKFTFANLAHQQTVFENIAAQTSRIRPETINIEALIQNERDRQRLQQFIDEGVRFHKKRTDATRKFFHFSNNTEEILGKHIFPGTQEIPRSTEFNQQLHDELEKALETLGMAQPETGSRIEAIFNRQIEGAKELYSYKGPSGVTEIHEKEVRHLHDLLMNVSTGFVKRKEGGIVSLAQFRNIKDNFIDRALNNVQIPLVPFVFEVPLSTFNFMKPTKDIFANIGMLKNAPELVKMGLDLSPFTHGLIMGDKLLTASPDLGVGSKINLVEGNFGVYKLRDSKSIKTLADTRSQPVEEYNNVIFHFKGNKDSKFKNWLYSNQHSFLSIDYSSEHGFIARPNNSVNTLLVKSLHGNGLDINPENLHPLQLAQFIADHGGQIGSNSPRGPKDLQLALRHILKEARKSTTDNADALAMLVEQLKHDRTINGMPSKMLDEIDGFVVKAMEKANDPKHIEEILNTPITGITTQGNKPISGMTSFLEKHVAKPLARSIDIIRGDIKGLYTKTLNEGGLPQQVKSKVLGADGLSKSMTRLQDSLLSQVIHSLGLGRLDQITDKNTEYEFAQLYNILHSDTDVDIEAIKNLKISQHLMDLGFGKDGVPHVERMRQLIDRIGSRNNFSQEAIDGVLIRKRELGELGTALLDHDQLMGISKDPLIKGKILDNLRTNLNNIQGLGVEKQNELLIDLVNKSDISNILHERFKLGRPFHPKPHKENPLTATNYYVLPKKGVKLNDLIEDPFSTIESLLGQAGNVGDFITSLIHPQKELTPFAASLQILLQKPNNIAQNVGIGLYGQDKLTVLRSTIGFLGKRVLPAVAAYEAYKNLNANLHQAHVDGLDDLGANFLANFGIIGARMKDAFGVTQQNKNLIYGLPGLDQYFHPRSEQEEKEYLFYGEEEVRPDRGWIVGSRSNLTGGEVQFARPNFYRRWHSHWTEADNVDISNPVHSWLPSPLHPLAPLGHILDPFNNWWTEKHKYDRPYMENRLGHGRGMMSGERLLASGGFGGGLGTSINGVGGPGGLGDYTPGNGQSAYLGLNKQLPPSELEHTNPWNMFADWVDASKKEMGMWGAAMQMLPFYPEHTADVPIQDPSQARNFARMAYSGNYGGATTFGFGEFLRRFIERNDQPTWAYSPYYNNQPRWLTQAKPELGRGDPYTRVKGIGEQVLPGDAFIDLHPWSSQLRVRGSNIGLSKDEIIEKWLNPAEPLEGENAEDIVEFGCVDEETEILTKEGWRSYKDLKTGEDILTLNHVTGFSEWKPIKAVNVYDVQDEELVSIEGLTHSSLTTKNHRWPIIKEKFKSQPYQRLTPERNWTTSDKLGFKNWKIILAAECSDLPVIKTWADEFVELVAWYWTEGSSIRERSIKISQSEFINPENVHRIRTCLTKLFGGMSLDMKSNQSINPPMWIEDKLPSGMSTFRLNIQASVDFFKVSKNKVVSLEFIKSLTKEQLQLFIDISYLADGKGFDEKGNSKNQLGQKNREFLDAFELACILLGKRTNIRECHMSTSGFKYTEHIIGFHNRNLFGLDHQRNNKKLVKYTGKVWCPTVENETWCARRKGKAFFTGNSRLHLQMQRSLRKQGILIDAEVSIFDKQNNISGTIDAIVNTPEGLEILDFKTQGGKRFLKGEVPEHYIDQLTTYMAITGIHKSALEFINRDDTSQTRMVPVEFDPERWEKILDKVNSAREEVNYLIGKHKISPFETYDLLDRIDVLAHVAPDSAQFKKYVEYAEKSGGFNGWENERLKELTKIAHDLTHPLNLYPRRGNIQLETQKLTVEDIAPDGTILTEAGSIKLAGVKWDNQAFIYQDADQVLARYGIAVGKKIPVTLLKGQFNPEVMADTPLEAIVGQANRRLIHSKYADADIEDRNPLASKTVRGDDHLFTNAWEAFVHSDNFLTNKFLRTRTGLEEYERGEVFGTNRTSWQHPIETFVEPTINSFISQNPLVASAKSAIVASLFFREKKSKGKAALIGAAIGATISSGRELYELISGKTWEPPRFRKQAEFDEYWDTLEFVKQASIYEHAKRMALKKEHVDIEKLEQADKRRRVGLGPWAMLALQARRRRDSTMYAFQVASGNLQQALTVIPKRDRQIAESIITTGSLKEKQRFYDLLPSAEKRVLGKFLNINPSDLPERPSLSKYFKNHFLPDGSWQGWNPSTSTQDLKTRAADDENLKIENPSAQSVERARAYSLGIAIPRMDSPTIGSIRRHIDELLSSGGFEGVNVQYSVSPAPYTSIDVQMDLQQDQTNELVQEMRKQT